MSINVQCGKCSMRYTTDDKAAGQRVVCPRCGNSVTVPTPAAKSADEIGGASSPQGAQTAARLAQTKKSSRRSKGRGKSGSKLQLSGRTGVLLAVLALMVVAAVVYLTVLRPGQFGSRPRRAPAVADAGPPASPQPETPPGPPQPNTTPTPPQPENPPTGDPSPNQGPPPGAEGHPTGPNDGQPPGPGYPQQPATPDGPAGLVQPAGQSQRPQDIAQWKRDDYFSARADGDSRLVEAIDHFGKRFVGKDTAARMLGQLLEPPKAAEKPVQGAQPGSEPQPSQQNPQLVQAIVTALGVNGTDAARSVLVQLLAGTLPIDDDKTAVDAALKALVANPSARTDEILFGVFSAADSLRPQPKGQIGAGELREMALAAVSSTASEGLRTKLAGYLVRPDVPQEWRAQIGEFLATEHPDNVGAQLVLYQGGETPAETKATLEQYFIGYSSAALTQILGIPGDLPGSPAGTSPQPGTRPGGAFGENDTGRGADGLVAGRPNVPGMGPDYGQPGGPNAPQAAATPPDPDAPFRRARQLWSPGTVATVEGRLGQLRSLGDQVQLLMLAGTFPVDSTRSAASKILHERWADGPAQLEAAGLSTSVITDPGLLLTIKTLPRRREADPKSSPGTTPGDPYQPENRFRPRPRSKSGEPGSATEAVETPKTPVEKRLQAERDWMKTSEGLVRAWCERLNAAGLARAGAAGGAAASPGGAEPNANLPVKLHPQANVVSEYHLSWPGDLGSKLSGIAPGPMEVHYLRITDKADLTKRLGFYRRQLQLNAPDVHSIANGSWMDRVQRVPKTEEQGPIDKTGWKRSVDILITMVQANPELARGEETDLVIQILSIEMKDPAKS